MTEDLTDVQRAVLFKLARNDAATGRDWTITADPDGAAIATGPATVRFTKQDGRITPYEIIQWLRHNGDIARSGGVVDLTTGTFRTDTEEATR